MNRVCLSAFVLIVSSGCGTSSYRIIQSPTASLGSFSSIMIEPLEVQGWLDANPGAEGRLGPHISQASSTISLVAERYLGERYRITNTPGGGTLRISSELIVFIPGSRAGRYFAGLFGAGKGTVGILSTLINGETDEVVGSAEVYGTVRGGRWGGPLSDSYNRCGKGLARLILDHSGG